MMAVKFDEDPVRHVAKGGRGAHSAGEHDATARGDIGGFHHGHVHRTEEAVARHLRHHRKVQVEEAGFALVDLAAEGRVEDAQAFGCRLDADAVAIDTQLAADPVLAPLIAARPGLRVPGAWDPFELAIRAILGQQVSVAAATRRTQAAIQLGISFCSGNTSVPAPLSGVVLNTLPSGSRPT